MGTFHSLQVVGRGSKTQLQVVENLRRLPYMLIQGHGAMVRAWRSADVAACRAVSNPAWCRIFTEISCFSLLNLGTLLRWCVLGQDTSP